MRVIRIAGGVGSGKSQVLEVLKEEYNAHVILADEVAKRLMEPGQPVFIRVVEALGTGILDSQGAIDRKKMADVIFSDPQKLAVVNAITHPMTWEAIVREVENSEKALVVVEAAVMGEEEPEIYDERWLIYASPETRIRRLRENRGYSREKSLSIMANQLSEEEIRRRCSVVIDNDGTLEHTRDQLQKILEDRGYKKP